MAYRRSRRGRSSGRGYSSGYKARGRRRTRKSYGGRRSYRGRSGVQRLRIEIAQPPAAATGMTPDALLSMLGKTPRAPRVAKF